MRISTETIDITRSLFLSYNLRIFMVIGVINGKKHVTEDYDKVRQLCYNNESVVYVKDYKKTKKRVSDTKGFA